jgi:hypothetical protein
LVVKVVVQLLPFIQLLLVLFCVPNSAVLLVPDNQLHQQVLVLEEAVYGAVVVVATVDAIVLRLQHWLQVQVDQATALRPAGAVQLEHWEQVLQQEMLDQPVVVYVVGPVVVVVDLVSHQALLPELVVLVVLVVAVVVVVVLHLTPVLVVEAATAGLDMP